MGIEEQFRRVAQSINAPEPKTRMNERLAPEFISANEAEKTSVIQFTAQEWELNQRGDVHGGAVASMFDTAMGMTSVVYSGGMPVATADLNISYIRPFTGQKFLFESKIHNLGRMMIRLHCVAKDAATGKTLATATSTFVPYRK